MLIMKLTTHLSILTLCSLALSSCSGVLLRGGTISAEKEVTTFSQSSSYNGVSDPIPVTVTKRVSKRYDVVSDKVLARASAQASGGPGIGLIPTMKDLATSD